MKVTVLYSPAPRQVLEWGLVLDDGATVAQALAASGLRTAFPEADLGGGSLGIWGRRASPAQRLIDGDRLEIYRPLRVDPKVARRERFRSQGVRAAGLFANKKSRR